MRPLIPCTLASALGLALAAAFPTASAQDAAATVHTVGARAAPTLVRDTRTAGLTDNIGLSAAQTERMQRVFTRVDSQLQGALSRHGARAGQMRNELNAIAGMPPGAKREQAIRAYQARHDGFYSGVLAESKVDLSALAREMQGIAPELKFEVRGRSIIGVPIQATGLQSSATRPAFRTSTPTTTARATTVPAPAPATSSTTRLTGFVDEDSRRCSAAASGNNRFTSNSVTSNSFAAVAGGCTSTARKHKTQDVPAGASASLDLGFSIQVKAFAAGVVGVGYSNARGFVVVNGDVVESHFVSAMAPLLWVTESEENRRGLTVTVPVRPGRPAELSFSTSTESLALPPSGANASATIDGITASLIVNP